MAAVVDYSLTASTAITFQTGQRATSQHTIVVEYTEDDPDDANSVWSVVSTTLYTVSGIGSDAQTATVRYPGAADLDGTLRITQIVDASRITDYTAAGAATGKNLNDEFDNLYQITDEVVDARGSEATLEDRLDLADTATATAQAAADAAQADADTTQAEVDAEEVTRAAADTALDARLTTAEEEIDDLVAGGLGLSYTGKAFQFLRANAGETNVEFSDTLALEQLKRVLFGTSTIRFTEAVFVDGTTQTYVRAFNGHAKNFVLTPKLSGYAVADRTIFDTTKAVFVETISVTATGAIRATFYAVAGWLDDGTDITLILQSRDGLSSSAAVSEVKIGADAIDDVATQAYADAAAGDLAAVVTTGTYSTSGAIDAYPTFEVFNINAFTASPDGAKFLVARIVSTVPLNGDTAVLRARNTYGGTDNIISVKVGDGTITSYSEIGLIPVVEDSGSWFVELSDDSVGGSVTIRGMGVIK